MKNTNILITVSYLTDAEGRYSVNHKEVRSFVLNETRNEYIELSDGSRSLH